MRRILILLILALAAGSAAAEVPEVLFPDAIVVVTESGDVVVRYQGPIIIDFGPNGSVYEVTAPEITAKDVLPPERWTGWPWVAGAAGFALGIVVWIVAEAVSGGWTLSGALSGGP